MYENEAGVGEGIRASSLDRGEVYVTSKLNNGAHEPDDVRACFDGTLSELGFDHIDLFLIHWPLPTLYDGDFVSTWKAMEELKADGRARSLGVSNFQVEHLERLETEADLTPAVNQIELHPYFANADVADRCRERGIGVEGWSPIAQGEVLDDETIAGIADRLDRTPGPGRPPLAHPARQHRHPEVGDAGADRGELRPVRLRAELRGHDGDRRSRPGRGRPQRLPPGRVRDGPRLSAGSSTPGP